MLRMDFFTHRTPPARLYRRAAAADVGAAGAPADVESVDELPPAGSPTAACSGSRGTDEVDRSLAGFLYGASIPPGWGKEQCSACSTPLSQARWAPVSRLLSSSNSSHRTAGDAARYTWQHTVGSNVHCGTSSGRSVCADSRPQR